MVLVSFNKNHLKLNDAQIVREKIPTIKELQAKAVYLFSDQWLLATQSCSSCSITSTRRFTIQITQHSILDP